MSTEVKKEVKEVKTKKTKKTSVSYTVKSMYNSMERLEELKLMNAEEKKAIEQTLEKVVARWIKNGM